MIYASLDMTNRRDQMAIALSKAMDLRMPKLLSKSI